MFYLDWVQTNKFVDVKTSNGLWKIGKVLNVEDRQVKVFCEGENCEFLIDSVNIAPFRRNTCKQIGCLNVFVSGSFSLDEL